MATSEETRRINIEINGQKANASLKEMSAAAAVMKNQLNKMAADDPGRKKLIKDFNDMKSKISGVNQEIHGVTKATGFMKAGFQTAMGALLPLLSIQKAFEFLGYAKKNFQENDAAVAQLKATLTSTGQAAGLTFNEINALSSKLQSKTLFGDDKTNGAAALLLTFTNIKKGVFEEALPAIQDMATKMAGDGPVDLKGATIQLGKALNDPIKGITALSKVGVSFTEGQKQTIKTMVELGDTAGAQKLILAELNKEFGGSAEAARKAGDGGFKSFMNTVGDMAEPLGKLISDGLNAASAALVELGEQMSSATDSFFKQKDAVDSLERNTVPLIDRYEELRGKSELSKAEQTELEEIIQKIAETIPTAITEFDKYGKAIGVSSEKAREFVELQRKILEVKNKEAIEEQTEALAKLEKSIDQVNKRLSDRDAEGNIVKWSERTSNTMGTTRTAVKLTGDEIANLQAKLAKLMDEKIGTQGLIDELKGIPPAIQEAGEVQEEVVRELSAKELAQLERQKQKLLAAQKQYALSSAQLEFDLQRLKVQLMDEGIDRVLAKLQLQHDREMVQIRKNKEEALALEGLTFEQKAAIADKFREEEELKEIELRRLKGEAIIAHDTQVFEEQKLLTKEEYNSKMEQEQEWFDLEQERIEERFQNGLISEAERNEALYELKRKALVRQLELIKAFHTEDSIEYLKARNILLAHEKTYTDKAKALAQEIKDFKLNMNIQIMSSAQEALQFALERFNQESHAYGIAQAVMKTFALAEIAMNLQREMSANAVAAAANPLNSVTAGAAGATQLAIANTASLIRAAIGTAKIIGFAEGGPTGDGLRVGSSGRMIDHTGHAIAGVVHDNEWVGPKWMYQSPRYAPIFDYLERERQRGFASGGPTSAPMPTAGGAEMSGDGLMLIADILMANQMELRAYQEDIRNWQREFRVVNDIRETEEGLTELRRVRNCGIKG